jgi:hypothetical protein
VGIYVSRRGNVGVSGWLAVGALVVKFLIGVLALAAIVAVYLIAGFGLAADRAIRLIPPYRARRYRLGPIEWPRELIASVR